MDNKRCCIHPDRVALGTCHTCGKPYCRECLVEGEEYYYCKSSECIPEGFMPRKQMDKYSHTGSGWQSYIAGLLSIPFGIFPGIYLMRGAKWAWYYVLFISITIAIYGTAKISLQQPATLVPPVYCGIILLLALLDVPWKWPTAVETQHQTEKPPAFPVSRKDWF